MSSGRKIAANKANAARSTGPKTATGKTVASGNAYKHGFAASMVDNAGRRSQVENLARELVLAQSGPCRREQYIIAEAELDLLRIRDVRAKIINEAIAGCGLSVANEFSDRGARGPGELPARVAPTGEARAVRASGSISSATRDKANVW